MQVKVSVILKMGTLRSFETPVTLPVDTRCNNPDNSNIQQDRCQNLKYRKEIGCFHNQQQFYCSAEFQKPLPTFRDPQVPQTQNVHGLNEQF
jgi:hypothetical protein